MTVIWEITQATQALKYIFIPMIIIETNPSAGFPKNSFLNIVSIEELYSWSPGSNFIPEKNIAINQKCHVGVTDRSQVSSEA